jgi:hypothetical protein
MNRLIVLQGIIEKIHCKIRLKPYHEDVPTEWQDWFGLPVLGYIEVAGPERIINVDWIELDPIVVTYYRRISAS